PTGSEFHRVLSEMWSSKDRMSRAKMGSDEIRAMVARAAEHADSVEIKENRKPININAMRGNNGGYASSKYQCWMCDEWHERNAGRLRCEKGERPECGVCGRPHLTKY